MYCDALAHKYSIISIGEKAKFDEIAQNCERLEFFMKIQILLYAVRFIYSQ